VHDRSTNSLAARSTAYHLAKIRETKIVREGHTENNHCARDVSIREQNWSQFFSKAEIDLSRAMYFFAKVCNLNFANYIYKLLSPLRISDYKKKICHYEISLR